jgi:HSP20 family protein
MTLINKRIPAPMPRFFDSYFLKDMLELPDLSVQKMRGSHPAVNIKENEQGFVLEVNAPGLEKDNFSIELNQDVLTISTVNKEEKEEKQGEKFYLREFNLHSFQRSFKFPENIINSEKIEASYEQGILRLILPKKEEVKIQPKQIKIA